MKSTHRNILIALGLSASLAVPGLALADNWKHGNSPNQYQAQRHDAHGRRDGDRDYARRDDYRGHEWREHHRWRGYDHHDHGWREPARYYRWHRGYGYNVYPSAYVSGFYYTPAPRVVIDLR
ncbi:MAG: hypothetical protein GC149_03610 [Gammaproteobacteria bacterium]|nr:hypothetical protein [Gammaproteobacteria bacterium]